MLRSGTTPSDDLARELQTLVKERFAAHAYPRTIHFLDELPKTPSGKLQRYLIRNARRDEIAQQLGALRSTSPTTRRQGTLPV